MIDSVAFYCRSKPQGADIVDICVKQRRCFIGYPLYKKDTLRSTDNLQACIVNPTVDDAEWAEALQHVGRTNEFNRNRNFIEKITVGSVCVVPRPSRGCVYISVIQSPFEIVDNPPWFSEYLESRGAAEHDNDKLVSHAADVSQSWKTGEFREVSLALIPGWIRKSMFGRSTYGMFWDHPLSHDPRKAVDILRALYENSYTPAPEYTTSIQEIKSRLVDNLTANSFEHLVVSLLQLEFPKEIWHQTGGSGDGGIDGFGSDENGKMIGLMQAKYYANDIPNLKQLAKESLVRRYAAILISDKELKSDGETQLLDIDWVAQKLEKHSNCLPLAITLRIGRP